MPWELYVMPFIAALIGWLTNVIAIKMLFWPRKPIKIKGLPWEIIGVLPKRQRDIAQNIGQVLNEELLPVQDLVDAVNTKELRVRAVVIICQKLDERIDRLLPRFIPDSAKQVIKKYVSDVVAAETENVFSNMSAHLASELQDSGLLGNLVEDKIQAFDLSQLEGLVFRIAKNELRYIEWFGALLGFVIGLLQSLFLFWRLS